MTIQEFSQMGVGRQPQSFSLSPAQLKTYREVIGKAIRENQRNAQESIIAASKIILNR